MQFHTWGFALQWGGGDQKDNSNRVLNDISGSFRLSYHFGYSSAILSSNSLCVYENRRGEDMQVTGGGIGEFCTENVI